MVSMSDKEQEIKETLHTPLFPILNSLLNTQSYNTACLTFIKYNITVGYSNNSIYLEAQT